MTFSSMMPRLNFIRTAKQNEENANHLPNTEIPKYENGRW